MGAIININQEACNGCGTCVSGCEKKILYIDEKTKKCAVSDETKCDRQAGCEKVCPSEAIKISR